MPIATEPPAEHLRACLREIPQAKRVAHQAFSIRIWRGLSWLESAEKASEPDEGFIYLWIGFNAIYGHLDDEGRGAADKASWQSFLARLVEHDSNDRLGDILRDAQQAVCRLVNSQYLYTPYWQDKPDWRERLRKAVQTTLVNYRNGYTLPILQELFERLYVLRLQVFHGAATRGSKLNRDTLEPATDLLGLLMPAMLQIMIAAGPGIDWGEICFPPRDQADT